jgi:hypothetical protein
MGRNNPKNIKAHNDKLHKAQDKEKVKKADRQEQLKVIVKKYNENKKLP